MAEQNNNFGCWLRFEWHLQLHHTAPCSLPLENIIKSNHFTARTTTRHCVPRRHFLLSTGLFLIHQATALTMNEAKLKRYQSDQPDEYFIHCQSLNHSTLNRSNHSPTIQGLLDARIDRLSRRFTARGNHARRKCRRRKQRNLQLGRGRYARRLQHHRCCANNVQVGVVGPSGFQHLFTPSPIYF